MECLLTCALVASATLVLGYVVAKKGWL